MKSTKAAISKWGCLLYDRIHKDAGFDALLSPEAQKETNPLSYDEIFKIMDKDAKNLGVHKTVLTKFKKTIAQFDIVPKKQAENLGLFKLLL